MGIFGTAWLVAVVVAATPLVLAAMGELISERAGVLNVGLEGMMISGAFFGFVGAEWSGSWVVGASTGLLAGALVGVFVAALSVWAKADQIVVGIGINLLGSSLTAFLFTELFSSGSRIALDRPTRVTIPGLSDLPVVGRALFDQQVFVYVAMASAVAVWVLLRWTGWGLSLRAAGENPSAADSAGLRVQALRWVGTVTAGALAGLGGAFLSIGQVGAFAQNMTAGRGFLALAAVIFGRWRPLGVLGACVIFGAADALQFRLQARGDVPVEVWVVAAVAMVGLAVHVVRHPRLERRPSRHIGAIAVLVSLGLGFAAGAATTPEFSMPPQLWLALPYVLTLVVLSGSVGRARVPTTLGVPYRRAPVYA